MLDSRPGADGASFGLVNGCEVKSEPRVKVVWTDLACITQKGEYMSHFGYSLWQSVLLGETP